MTAKAEAKISAPNHNEALTILMEECAEVIQAAAKIKRFGPETRNSETNLPFNSVLTNELADLYTILLSRRPNRRADTAERTANRASD